MGRPTGNLIGVTQLGVGIDEGQRMIVLLMRGSGQTLKVAIPPSKARDLIRQLTDICEKFEGMADEPKIIVPMNGTRIPFKGGH